MTFIVGLLGVFVDLFRRPNRLYKCPLFLFVL